MILSIENDMTSSITTEIWKRLPNYPYEISNLGRVRRLNNKRLLKPQIRSDYYTVTLSKDNRQETYSIHSLVALVFIGTPPSNSIVNHCDGNKLNCRLDNLEYITHQQNSLHSTRVLNKRKPSLCDSLSDSELYWIKFLSDSVNWTHNKIAEAFNISIETVSSAIRKQTRIEKESKSMWDQNVFDYGEN